METNKNFKSLSFSILMANYNNERYIQEAIESVIGQTYPNWELIIVDDGSTDNSIKIIKPFLKDKRIKLIRNKKNLGVGWAKKIAAENASNDIIGILDSDDRVYMKALETMAEAYQKYPEYGFIYSTMWACDSELKNCKVADWICSIIPEKTCIFASNISQFRTFRREAYEKTLGFNPNLKAAVDKDLYLKLEEVTKFKFINIPLYYVRQHNKGISQGRNKFQARINHYIAKCNAYYRRKNTNFPNLTIKDLYLEYYKITFHNIIKFLRFNFRLFRIWNLIDIFLKKFQKLPKFIKKKLEFIRKNEKMKKF